MKLTMAEYYTPNGRNIHKKGITPDVEVEYQQDENIRMHDNQLDAALEQVEKIKSINNRNPEEMPKTANFL